MKSIKIKNNEISNISSTLHNNCWNYDYQRLKELIETNLRQRGIGNLNGVKFARCIVELERIYGIRNGSAGNDGTKRHNKNSEQDNLTGKTQSKIAEDMGISKQQLSDYKKLLTLIPELQELVETGQMNSTVGYKNHIKRKLECQNQRISSLLLALEYGMI